MKNILITGGAGFIGSHLADRLLARGYRVRALDNLDPQVHPSGARPSQASSNCWLPGIDFMAMLRRGPAATRLTRTPSGPSSRAR